MNATIETHWSRILHCDVLAAHAGMPHPSEATGGEAPLGTGSSQTSAARDAASWTGAQRSASRASQFRKER